MRFVRVEIKNFRTIKSLQWTLAGENACLIGPGDIGKSTILDAIEAALAPRWTIPFADTDFPDAKTTEPIEIRLTLGEVPRQLLRDDKYGLEKRGWSPSGELHDEPEDGDADVLTVSLRVDSSLEPEWTVVNDRNPEGRPLAFRDRESLPVARIGAEVDRHLGWGRGSTLARITGSTEEIGPLLTDALREVRKKADATDLPKLKATAKEVETLAATMGARAKHGLQPAIELGTIGATSAALSLHDGKIPLRAAGLGTRRLAAIALQHAHTDEGTLLLVDEIEHGLEPYRLQHLVRVLTGEHAASQVVMTTHSSVVVIEMPARNLHVVRNVGGVATVVSMGSGVDAQKLARSSPYALLARRVVVCEGRMEMGMVRALDSARLAANRASLAFQGVSPLDGQGSSAVGRARLLQSLGYEACLFIDSDVESHPEELAAFVKAGGTVLRWSTGFATEERVCRDITVRALDELLHTACEAHGQRAVLEAIGERCTPPKKPPPQTRRCAEWVAAGVSEPALRSAVAAAAKSRGWFKSIAGGEDVGRIVVAARPKDATTELEKKLRELEKWVDAV